MRDPNEPHLDVACPRPGRSLSPHAAGSHCRDCDTVVHDTALHTRAELHALAAERDHVCIEVALDELGRPRFKDGPVRRRLTVLALGAALAGCGDDLPPAPPPAAPVPTAVVAPPEPTTPAPPEPEVEAPPPTGDAEAAAPIAPAEPITEPAAAEPAPAAPTARRRAPAPPPPVIPRRPIGLWRGR